MATVLVVEDEPALIDTLEYSLTRQGYRVHVAADGVKALEVARREQPDLILLDVMLPGLDGFEVCQRLRSQHNDTPVLVISARDAVRDRVHGLDCGADDYLVKPFAFEELLARLRALDRRGRNRQVARSLSYGPLTIDPVDHRVTLGTQVMSFTATEYRLLEYLVRRAEAIVTRDQLAEYVWGGDYDPFSNVADVYVGYIRRKLQTALSCPLIHTVRGLGYILKSETPEP